MTGYYFYFFCEYAKVGGIQRTSGVNTMPAVDGLVGIPFHLLAEYIAFAVLRVYISYDSALALEIVLEGVVAKFLLSLHKRGFVYAGIYYFRRWRCCNNIVSLLVADFSCI